LFTLSTLGHTPHSSRAKRAALVATFCLLLWDGYIGTLIHRFYTDNPTQAAIQYSDEVE
jgi:hypothetical protein